MQLVAEFQPDWMGFFPINLTALLLHFYAIFGCLLLLADITLKPAPYF